MLQGTIVRKFVTVDPRNAATEAIANKQDLDLDYLTYTTGVVFGDLATTTLIYKFTNLAVNYDTFNAVDLGAFDSISTLSVASISAIALAMLF